MEKCIINNILQLNTISQIPIDGKIETIDNKISIYQNTWLNWAKRKYYNDDKNSALYAITKVYEDVIEISNIMINTDYFKSELLKSLYNNLNNSINGLKNISDHYDKFNKDNTFSLTIKTLKETRILPQIKKIENYLKFKGY